MATCLLRRLGGLPQAAAVLLAACSEAGRPHQLVQLSAFASSAAAAAGKLVGVCVFERLPVVVPRPPEWELEYAAWQAQLRQQQKHYKILPREFTDQKQSEEVDGGAAGRWQPAPRVTEADTAGDRRSLRRRLDQFLFLLVRPRGQADASWTLPQAENAEGETMRQTAERALAEAVQLEGVQPFFVGNAPGGHHAPGDSTTLFFHRAQLIAGAPALRQGGPWGDHVWAAKDELGEYIRDPALVELLQRML